MAAYRKEIIVGPKIKFFTLSCLFLLLSLVILLSTFRLRTLVFVLDNRNIDVLSLPHEVRPHVKQFPPAPLLSFLQRELGGNENIKVGLVNTEKKDDEYWYSLGEAVSVGFDRVSNKIQWKDFMREWIDEEHMYGKGPKCPDMPMPEFEKYPDDLDVVIARVPCGNESDAVNGNGIRDVYRLQVNLVVANLVARRRNDQPVYVVFIGTCGPMIEIFRCDDLIKHEEDIWIYKPDLRRLQQKVQMPVGSCQIASPFVKQGAIDYNFTKLQKSNPIDNPREAYVTVLHSSEAYVCGAISLAQSIINTNSTKDMVILVDESITPKTRRELEFAGWKLKLIDRIHSPHARKNAYNEWNYSKLRIWQLTEYDKVMFIDSDLILLKNIDNFFAYPQLSAVGNDKVRFNSGIMLIEPSKCMFESLMKKRYTVFSYNGGDQGFLNEVFTWWHRWPKRLNHLKIRPKDPSVPEIPESRYAVHFLGFKPWTCYRDYDCNWLRMDHNPFASDVAHRMWWQVYDLMPERLQKVCGLTKVKDRRIQQWRSMAENAKLPDEHWKINITDPRHIDLVD
ncbi:hypothetical protein MKW94_015212 [Papaver nudicaule]|uniref:Hexosyltransferase n=1 Tax=Papaver nudicaule TaxID=74823 RepID=A0AA41VMS8_PAPNU|nr:hypothetical protein [Papaver nudicaule]